MKCTRLNMLLILAPLVGLVACATTAGSAYSTEPGSVEHDYEYVISSPADTKNTFTSEPMRTHIKTIDGVNVVYQYDQPVPSFDTWETREEGRNHMSLNGEWYFTTDPEDRGVEEQWYSPLYDHSSWEKRPVLAVGTWMTIAPIMSGAKGIHFTTGMLGMCEHSNSMIPGWISM